MAGTLETPPFIFPSLSLELFLSLNLATVILQLVKNMCFQWLWVRGTYPAQLDTVHTFQGCCSGFQWMVNDPHDADLLVSVQP